jgi:hypothetical protein
MTPDRRDQGQIKQRSSKRGKRPPPAITNEHASPCFVGIRALPTPPTEPQTAFASRRSPVRSRLAPCNPAQRCLDAVGQGDRTNEDVAAADSWQQVLYPDPSSAPRPFRHGRSAAARLKSRIVPWMSSSEIAVANLHRNSGSNVKRLSLFARFSDALCRRLVLRVAALAQCMSAALILSRSVKSRRPWPPLVPQRVHTRRKSSDSSLLCRARTGCRPCRGRLCLPGPHRHSARVQSKWCGNQSLRAQYVPWLRIRTSSTYTH